MTDKEMLDYLDSLGDDFNKWVLQTEQDYPNVKGCVWLPCWKEKECQTPSDRGIAAVKTAET
jgi:hypothetical protein